MKKIKWALGALLCLCGSAAAQVPEANDVEEVVVTARRIGVPVWRVGDETSTLILVVHINAVPKTANWRPQELTKVVAEADSVIFPHEDTASPADVARAIWRARSIVFLPKGKTLADYIDEPTRARLEALKAQGAVSKSYMRLHPWVTSEELLDRTGAEKNSGPDLADVVAKAVRSGRGKRETVAVVTGRQLLDAYFNAGPAAHIPCLKASLTAAEAGPAAAAERIEDYTRYRVAAVVRSPVEQAYGACWPEGGEPTSSALRADWRTKIRARVGRPGVTLAVVPLTYLAEPNGLLDMLAAEGRTVDGPRWRD